MLYSVHLIPGLVYIQVRRTVAFLESPEDVSIDGKAVFEGMEDKNRREMLSRFEYWQRGQHHDKYFHGFNDPKYRNCFVFKRKQAGTYHRFYGFLINPRPLTDPGYLVCVLVSHVQKNTEQTDPSQLDGINALRIKEEVVRAVKKAFPELTGGRHGSLDVRKQ